MSMLQPRAKLAAVMFALSLSPQPPAKIMYADTALFTQGPSSLHTHSAAPREYKGRVIVVPRREANGSNNTWANANVSTPIKGGHLKTSWQKDAAME